MPLSHRRRKELASLSRKKGRLALGQYLVEGVRSVEAAVQAGAPLVEIVATEAALAEVRTAALAEAATVPVIVATAPDFARITDVQTSQGIAAVVQLPRTDETTLARAATILALDGVQDPGNVGTLLRTAAWFGVGGVLAGPDTADFFQPKVVRAAMGGLWDLTLAQTDDLAAALGRLRRAGFTRYGADLGGTPAHRWQPRQPSVLVLGSEAHGLSAAVLGGLDERVSIAGAAGRRGTESLNVAVAGGILAYRWLGSAAGG